MQKGFLLEQLEEKPKGNQQTLVRLEAVVETKMVIILPLWTSIFKHFNIHLTQQQIYSNNKLNDNYNFDRQQNTNTYLKCLDNKPGKRDKSARILVHTGRTGDE